MDALTVRNIEKGDLWKIQWWWPAHNWGDGPPPAILPDDGAIAELNGGPTAAAFLYLGFNSKCAWLEFLVTNPHNSPRVSAKSLKLVIQHLLDVASKNGVLMVYSSLKNRGLIKMYEKFGFVQGDTGCTEMVRRP
jgi:hypothetical protein